MLKGDNYESSSTVRILSGWSRMRSFIPSLGDKSDMRVEKEKDKMPPKRCMEEWGAGPIIHSE